MDRAGSELRVASFDPRLYSVFFGIGGAAGAPTSRIDDNSGRGGPDAALKVRDYVERRLGGRAAQKQAFAHVGKIVSQANDFSVQLAAGNFTKTLKPVPTTPALRASRQRPSLLDEIKELRGPATVSRSNICACVARLAARVNSLRGNEIYRANDLARTGRGWQPGTVSKYAFSPHPIAPARGDVDGRMGARGGKFIASRCPLWAGPMRLAGINPQKGIAD